MSTVVVAVTTLVLLLAVTTAVYAPGRRYVCVTTWLLLTCPSPRLHVYATVEPAATVAVKVVTLPSTVGLSLTAFNPLIGVSVAVIVTTVVAVVLPTLLLAVTIAVKALALG